jgi:two-component system chemotaxis sensor kinase CheA
MTDRHREAFREEANELLIELEAALLELEKNPEDADLIGRVFRAMHTIKGSGSMFGFDELALFTHNIETVYDYIRNGKLSISKYLIDQTLLACDEIRKMVQDEKEDDSGLRSGLVASFKSLIETTTCADSVNTSALSNDTKKDSQTKPASTQITYRVRFIPAPELFASGSNPILLLNELRDLGMCHVVAHTERIPSLTEINPEDCYTYWDIVLTTDKGIDAIKDVFIFIDDTSEIRIDVIDQEGILNDEDNQRKLGEILIDRGDLNVEDLKKVLADQKKIGELLVDAKVIDEGHVQAALVEQQHVREVRQKRQVAEASASVRVPAEKLDRLVNMVGELVTVQSRLNELSARFNELELIQVAEEVERLTAELRDNTMSIRMLPIGSTFSRFQRLVRDLSGELGKDIILETDGAETELDKTVIEKLNDPLVHLIRNSIDHGIEKPEIRRDLGKLAKGIIHLSAEHAGANVLIRISDDGKGLDADAIRAKAVEKGLLTPDLQIAEKELFSLIFAPGFSTAKEVTNVSGRGVGMDVVKRGIDALQGTIDITSQKGVGTTITLKLPLTLAIIDGLLVSISEEFYVMPLSAIEECVELTRDDVAKAHGKELANIRGEIVPYIRLREKFNMDGTVPAIEQIVTARIDGRRIGFVVDQVVGQHQTVIKSLGKTYMQIDEISGATILGDGKVALILDLPKIVESSEREEKARNGRSLN